MASLQHPAVYAALGASMSIDDCAGGSGRRAASLLWRNHDDDFPGWPGRDLTARDPTARLALLATGDATAARRAISTVVDNGRLVLASLRSLMGSEAPIVVATVYDPSDGSGDAGRLGLPPWPEPLTLTAELNRVLRMLAEDNRRWRPMCMPASSAMALPPGTPPGRPPAHVIVTCGTAI